jgi:hypothetical protein
VVKKWSGGAAKEVPGLKLPTFVDASVQIIINDPFTVPAAFAESVWSEGILQLIFHFVFFVMQ